MDAITTTILDQLFSHGTKWLSNLGRAKTERKLQSVQALRHVITACRETAVYIRQLNDKGQPDHQIESHISVLWTDLGLSLEDLGIPKLAKRCQIKGKHWSDPTHYDRDFLEKADISLENMERLAHVVLAEINR